MVTEDCTVTKAYDNALALDLVIRPLYACDSTPVEVMSLWLCALEGNVFLPFMGTGGRVVSLTCRLLGTIIGVLEVEGLTNLTFAVLGVVTSFE